MSKTGATETTNTTSSLPEWVEPYYQDLMARADTASSADYVPYENQRLADQSDATLQSYNMVSGIASAGTPYIDTALQKTQGLQTWKAAPIASQDTSTNSMVGADLSGYVDPYIENVLDVQTSRAQRKYAEDQNSREAAAVAAGAFGGDRRYVADSLAARDLNEQLQAIEAEGLSAAWNNATGLWQTDEARRTATGIANADRNLQGQISNADSQIRSKQLQLDAATQAGILSQTQQDLQLAAANALAASGASQEAYQQTGLDLAYEDFMRQQNWDKDQLTWYASLLSGAPISADTSTSTSTSQDTLSQILGVLLAGAGVYGAVT